MDIPGEGSGKCSGYRADLRTFINMLRSHGNSCWKNPPTVPEAQSVWHCHYRGFDWQEWNTIPSRKNTVGHCTVSSICHYSKRMCSLLCNQFISPFNVLYWGLWCTDNNTLNKLICKTSNTVGVELNSPTEVSEMNPSCSQYWKIPHTLSISCWTATGAPSAKDSFNHNASLDASEFYVTCSPVFTCLCCTLLCFLSVTFLSYFYLIMHHFFK